MNGVFTRRGQPLLALMALLGAWVSARAMMWEPKPAPHLRALIAAASMSDEVVPSGLEDAMRRIEDDGGRGMRPQAPMSVPMSDVPLRGDVYLEDFPAETQGHLREAAPASPVPSRGNLARGLAEPELTLPPAPVPQARPSAPAFQPVPANVAIGHHLLWMAALARVPMPASLTVPSGASGGDQRIAAALPTATPGAKRWSADGWILWRRGSTGATSGALLTPSYGASQAGAVVRYRLAPSSELRPAAYLRTTAALNGSSEREAALGLQLRPIRGLPVALAGEARLTAVPGRTFVRPAVFAVTELAPFGLPLGLRGEIYGQAGYVGGTFATGFADGQMRIDRRFLSVGKGDLRLGGGVWGGVQKGASRVDAGPTLMLGRPLGGSGSMRLAADWRFRVAGKAAPGSGPAVTLSAGF